MLFPDARFQRRLRWFELKVSIRKNFYFSGFSYKEVRKESKWREWWNWFLKPLFLFSSLSAFFLSFFFSLPLTHMTKAILLCRPFGVGEGGAVQLWRDREGACRVLGLHSTTKNILCAWKFQKRNSVFRKFDIKFFVFWFECHDFASFLGWQVWSWALQTLVSRLFFHF